MFTSGNEYHSYLSKALRQLDNKLDKECLISINRAIELFPDKWEAYIRKGDYYGTIKDYSSAKECYEIALAKKPYCEYAYFNLGQVALNTSEKDSAINYFKMALNVNNKLFEAYYLLIETLIDTDQLQTAYDYAKEGVGHFPKDGKLNYILAFMELGRFHRGISELSKDIIKYLDIAQKNGIPKSVTYTIRGQYYYEVQDWNNAEKYLYKSRVYDDSETNDLMLCQILLSSNEIEKAKNLLEDMIEYGSEFAESQLENLYKLFPAYRN